MGGVHGTGELMPIGTQGVGGVSGTGELMPGGTWGVGGVHGYRLMLCFRGQLLTVHVCVC